MIKTFFSFVRICRVSSSSYDKELESSKSVEFLLLDSLLGSIITLLYDRGTKLMSFYRIPVTLGYLDDFFL